MRLGGRLLLSVLLLTMYLPVAVAQAATETIVISLNANETAGVVDMNVAVTAYADGIQDPSYTGTVAFTSTDPSATLPFSYLFNGTDAGTHVFSVTFATAGPRTLIVTDDGSLTSSAPTTVAAGALDHVVLTPSSATIASGGSQPYTTAAYDAFSNLIGDVTPSAVLGITPDGSCASGSCTASVPGPHTVTSTYLAKSNTAALTVSNNPPVANPDAAIVLENAASTPIPVLGNDTDVDGDTLTVTTVSTPSHGTATVDGGGGGVHYTPALNFHGSDSFTYTISDGNGGTATATVTVTVTYVNQLPVAVDDAATVLENATSTAIPVLANDTDVDGDTLIVTGVSASSHGTATVDGGGAGVHYTPALNYSGADSFTYNISDGHGGVDTGNVTITVTPVNQVPSFTKGANRTALENGGAQSVTNWATAISPGPANESSQILSFIVTNDNNALFSAQPAISPTGTLTYTPAANANGTTIVSVQIHDNGGTLNGGVDTSGPQTFTITVTLVNHVPSFIKGANITLPEEPSPVLHTFVGWATGFSPGPPSESTQTLLAYHLTNDHPLLFSAEPAIDALGNLTFTLAANRNGPANVTVTVQDNGGTLNGGSDTSVPQMFTITVSGVDHPPAATNDFPTVVQGSGPVTIDVLANDSDPDGDPLTIASVTQGTNGHVAITANKKFLTYHPTGSFIGTDSFTYTASDGRGGLSVGTVLVTVVKDTFAPVTTAPRALIVAPPIGSSAQITLTWSGTDRGFGIKTYQLQVSRNHAPWASVTIRVGAHAARQTVALNSFYQYRVRAIDRVGNVGRWASLSFTPTLYRETSATYSGTWKSAALSGALNGSVKYTSALGAVASMTCTCSAFAWIGPKGPTRDTAQVYVDTILIGTFSEKSTRTLAAQEVMSVTWASRATHTIGISVAGTGRVDVDGFLILH
jgi:hypothetical protein